jgi:hypothetical protein
MRRSKLWYGLWLAVALPLPAFGQELQQLQTDNLQLVWFHPTGDYLAPHVARSFENSMLWQQQVFGWVPDGRTNLLLKDFSDYGNAGARSAPNNALIVDVAPFSYAFETFVASERIFSLMNHELIHVATMDQWTETDMAWREFFRGKVQINPDHPETLLYRYLTVPRTVVPRWYLEGSAVFFETWMAGGLGRAQGAYDEMVFRAMVRDDAHFYGPTGLASEGTRVDFQVGVNNYLYGTRFMSYLGLQYSPDHVLRWVARREGSRRYYADQFEQVFERPLESAWAEWIAWERQFQQANLAQVRQHPVSRHQPLSRQGLGSVSRAYLDPASGRIIAAFRYPGVAAYVGAMSLEDGSIQPLVDVKGPMLYRVTSLAFDPDSRTAFYTTDNNAGYRDIMALDVRDGSTRMLQHDARIGDLAFNRADRSLWGIRHMNGIVTLVRMAPPYAEFNQVHSWPYGEIVYDIDISPDGRLLSASHTAINGDQTLRVMSLESLLADDATPIQQFDFGSAVPEGFVFAPDGASLYGSSYYTGVSNIFRYSLANRRIEALSNAETGFFRPLPLPDGRLLAFDYGGQGLLPGFIDPQPREDLSAVTLLGAQIAERHPQVREWNVGPPSRIDLPSITRSQGEYDSVREIGLQSIYPVVEGYKESWALGMHANFADPVGLDRITLTASYSPDEDLDEGERLHFEGLWRHRGWRVRFQYNDADFYDLFGPTRSSRRGNSWTFGYEKALIFDTPRTLDMDLAVQLHNNLDTLPAFQDIGVTTDELVTARLSLDYAYLLNSLGNVDEEKGVRWNLNAVVSHAAGNTIPSVFGGFDVGTPFLFDHSSLWLRTGAGWSDGAAEDPYANFFFGGFGNNWIDDDEVKRYREHFSFPGFEINQIGGRSYARAMLEWNLPPVRFSNIGTPANYLSWARAALFAGTLVLDPGRDGSRTFGTLGAQLDLQFYVMHDQEMTLSVGYARGFEDGGDGSDEWMLSLKILH